MFFSCLIKKGDPGGGGVVIIGCIFKELFLPPTPVSSIVKTELISNCNIILYDKRCMENTVKREYTLKRAMFLFKNSAESRQQELGSNPANS
jgi:hypothetical protein